MDEPAPLPPLADAAVSVVLPVYGGGAEAADVVAGWRDQFKALKRECEILLPVSEANPDVAAVREMPALQEPPCRLLTYPEAEAEGPALRAAIAAVKHPLALFAGADTQYHPKELEAFLKLIAEVHLVCGYRVYQPPPGWVRVLDVFKKVFARVLLGYTPPARDCWLGGRGWGRRRLARWIFGLRLQDVECRLRLFRREVLEQFPLQSQGGFAYIEMLAKANHLGCIMAETPVSWMPPKVFPRDPTFSADAMAVLRHPEFFDPTKKQTVETFAGEGG